MSRTVSATAAVDLANELIVRGLLDESAIKTLSLPLFALYQRHQKGESIIENRISEADFLGLWHVADKHTSHSSFGFDIGLKVNVQAKGLLVNWLSCCETLMEAFKVFQRNIALLNQSEKWSITQKPERVSLCFEFDTDKESKLDYPVMAIERSMVALIAWANFFSDSTLRISSASFAFKQPMHADKYTKVFGPDIHFNADKNVIELHANQLNTKLQGANPYLRDLLEKRSKKIALSVADSASTKAAVSRLLKQDLPRYCHLDDLLKTLHMSRASLYRKLKQEACSFTDLLLQERLQQLARHDLTFSSERAENISEALGFSDVSSFYKFLKRHSSILKHS